jgi:hypothetical protein
MHLNTFLTTPTIAEILSQTANSGCMTRSEYNELMYLSSAIEQSEEDLDTIQRLFYALKRGWLQLID